MTEQTLEEWMNEGKQHFGSDFKKWKFQCPACKHVSSIEDFIKLGADPNDAYQKCIGRVNGKGNKNQTDEGDGCNWAAYGLFGTLGNGRTVITDDGKKVETFDFAVEQEAI